MNRWWRRGCEPDGRAVHGRSEATPSPADSFARFTRSVIHRIDCVASSRSFGPLTKTSRGVGHGQSRDRHAPPHRRDGRRAGVSDQRERTPRARVTAGLRPSRTGWGGRGRGSSRPCTVRPSRLHQFPRSRRFTDPSRHNLQVHRIRRTPSPPSLVAHTYTCTAPNNTSTPRTSEAFVTSGMTTSSGSRLNR